MTATRRSAAIGLVLTAVAMGVLWSVPGRVDRSTQELLLNLLLWVGVAQAWNIIGGIGGQLSLGHSVFIGAGGYTTAMLLLKTDIGWPVALVAAGVVSAALAWAVAFPLLRLSGVSFTIGSSALALAALAWMVTWTWTGESRGITVPLDSVPDREAKFRLVALLAVLTCVVAAMVLRSSFGLRLMAVRDDEHAAAALGVPAEQVKRRAFVLSAGLTGLVGAAVSLNQVYIEPNSMFGLTWVVTALVMVVVGGAGTVEGPVIGAFVIYYLVNRSLEDQPVVQAILGGVLVILVIVLAPRGIAGLLRSGLARVRSRGAPRSPSPEAVTAGRD